MFVAPSPENADAVSFGQINQLLGQAGFADAWLAGQHHHTAPAGEGFTQGSGQYSQFLLAANEDRV